MRAMVIALAVTAVLASQSSRASDPSNPIKVECDGTTVTQVDAVDNRFDKTEQVPFHGVFELYTAEAHLIDGPLTFEKVYPASSTASDPTKLQFQAKDGGLTFFKETGRFEIIRLKFEPGTALGQDNMTTETTTGTCHPFAPSHVFDQSQ